MKKFQLLFFVLFLSAGFVQAQSLEDLQSMKSEKEAVIGDLQGQIDALQSEVDGIQADIDKMSGWRKGFTGILGFDFNNSNGWVANPNPDASSSALNIGVTAFANKDMEKSFWNNKAVITKSWQDVDLTDADSGAEEDGLFDNGTVDIFNVQSLYGYKLSDKLAVSAMGDLNTSLGNFLSPGVLDIGAGITWLPMSNLTVVIHPLNYHMAFSGVDGVDTEGAFGAKIRADYTESFNVAGKAFNWSSTLMTFVPYSGTDEGQPTLFEYTWLNTLSFEVWKGIGVGVGFGIRNAEFESMDTQTYQSVGLSYNF
ncbi:MAG: DUF3078 domain-containing protein [Saprospiraceae bacterium]|nr:DUF3078 domain-containing protein [Bacteroidia bacterium]MBT8230646.1 DUF3078 domain-containing protein [Bacteroidia bacterium]NNF22231.1 DUF3078 domain-containing protein [Saprospiraceae bacterium]